MKTIDERVLDIEKADFHTKFKHDNALRTNVMERVLNTPDEKFDLISNNCVSLKINDDIKIMLNETNGDAEINIYQNGFMANSFLYKEPYTLSVWCETKEKQSSDCEMLRNKIKSIRKIKLEVTAESKKHMSEKTKRFYAVFDAISSAV